MSGGKRRPVAEVVIDASALLALLNDEPGAAEVAEALSGGITSSVNLSEVVAKLSEAGMPEEAIRKTLQLLELKILPFEEEQAYQAGFLRPSTRQMGISSGDRACVSLAKMLDIPVLTTDRVWKELSLGVTIKVIR